MLFWLFVSSDSGALLKPEAHDLIVSRALQPFPLRLVQTMNVARSLVLDLAFYRAALPGRMAPRRTACHRWQKVPPVSDSNGSNRSLNELQVGEVALHRAAGGTYA